MIFNKHLNLEGQHAFLSPSSWRWINYSIDKLYETYDNSDAAKMGTKLHAFAAQCIQLNQKLPRSKKTLNMYVNDAINYNMTPEQVLYYSEYCFGTADAISFRDDILRIHDYKSGTTLAHIEQLEVYAALFCLEYGVKPEYIKIILRLYQNNEVTEYIPSPEEINNIMDTIVMFTEALNKHDNEVQYGS